MYGFVNSALEKLIKRRFGFEKWDEIRHYANVIIGETDSFQVNHVYKDEDTYTLVAAASEVLGLDPATLLEMFGEQFLLWCQESGYSKTLQLLGRSLQDFLTNLDALHDHLSIIYPQMDAPSFRCTAGLKKSEFLLHYYSERNGLENIVMGIVKSVAREFYNVEVEMKLLVRKGLENDHSIFSIRETAYYHSNDAVDGEAESELFETVTDVQLISSQTFCRAFPFHIIFDPSMQILQVGSSLSWVLPGLKQKESKLFDYFALERPRMKLTFDNLVSHINTIFILRMLPAATSPNDKTNRLGFNSGSDPMRLRGQMIYVAESDTMLFLCSPRVKRLHDLEQRGLYLSDIPIHDATRGLLMMGQAAESEFTNSVRLEELIIQLKVVQKSLEEEKQRMSELLREMLPVSVADTLMSGQTVEAERFDSVTILFSDIVGFTSICSQSEPMQVVNMLNKLYSMFDQVVGQNQVYKVETIGDAYMVVGGLPERNTVHAECVANQALDMMYYCKQVLRPDKNEPIVMRIGIHSGDVVAGIVGRRMPRYCLFGNTVNVASRAESNGMPGKIQVTEFTHKLLQDKPNFEFEYRGPMEFKNVPAPVNCYFLLANTARDGSTPLVVPDEPVQAFEFIVSRQASPPSTPMVTPMRSFYDSGPSHSVPDINVTHPTPSETPNTTPPTSTRSSLAGACPFSFTPSTDSESDGEGPIYFRSGVSEYNGKRPTDLELLIRDSQVVAERVDIRMSPLREDSLEEEQLEQTTDEQCGDIVSEGMDNRVIPDAGKSQNSRKVSDASNQSYESGIESSRLSDTSKEGDIVRKLSDSSGSEDMDYGTKRYRVGSVSKAVQFFDTWGRQRRTGLTTTVDKRQRLSSESGIERQTPPAPEILAKGTNVIVNGRPERKSD